MKKAVVFTAALMALAVPSSALATFPGQNGRIAFSGINTVLANGRGVRDLPRGFDPSWSANGKRIAFVRNVGGGSFEHSDIFTMRADGSGVRRLTDDSPDDESVPAWSPNGGRILFSRGDGYVVSVRSLDGSNPRILSTAAPGTGLDWSANGQIAFSRGIGDGIWIMRSDGSHERQLTFPAAQTSDSFPRFSPDGAKITFTRVRHAYTDDAVSSVWVMRRNGSDRHPLPYPCAPGQVYSPDGRLFVVPDPKTRGIVTVTTRCTHKRLIVPDAGTYGLSWQPLP